MCFIVDKNYVRVHNKDIIVFKFIEHISYLPNDCDSSENLFITAYMFAKIPPDGKLIPSSNYFNELEVNDTVEYDVVGEGAIHSFYASSISDWTSRLIHGFIAKAIIPAGTKFITDGKAFISEKLIVDFNTQFVCRDYIGTDQQWMEDKQVFVNKCLKLNQNP